MVQKKRLFFGLEVFCPWPNLPNGRQLIIENRHLTICFLGSVDYEKFNQFLQTFPKPDFYISPAGFFDSVIFLPKKSPNVAAFHAYLFNFAILQNYKEKLRNWLQIIKAATHDHHPWIAHVTVARQPFDQSEWKKAFAALPFICGNIVLYESLSHSKYERLWSYPLVCPFEEIPHVADIAFEIRGLSFLQLYQNAFTVLSFRFPPMAGMLSHRETFESLDDVIVQLNMDFAIIDAKIGIPFKAISYHGDFQERQYLKWEMVVDV